MDAAKSAGPMHDRATSAITKTTTIKKTITTTTATDRSPVNRLLIAFTAVRSKNVQ